MSNKKGEKTGPIPTASEEAKKLFERAYLTRQLELVGGKISELSRRVDMERTNLYRKLQSLDIEYKKKKKTTS